MCLTWNIWNIRNAQRKKVCQYWYLDPLGETWSKCSRIWPVYMTMKLLPRYPRATNTPGDTRKKIIRRARLNMRKNFFTVRVGQVWNKLPEVVAFAACVEKSTELNWNDVLRDVIFSNALTSMRFNLTVGDLRAWASDYVLANLLKGTPLVHVRYLYKFCAVGYQKI